MRTAIVYYSLTGNTDFAAKEIVRRIGAEALRIEPVKRYHDKGFRKFLWGGKSAIMGEEPELQPYIFDPADYDRIILGTPVWASTMAPPVRTFIRQNAAGLKGKKISFLICCSGGVSGAEKTAERMCGLIGEADFGEALILIDPFEKRTAENDAKLNSFCSKII